MQARRLRRAALTSPLLIALTACGTTRAVVPEALLKPNCWATLPAELKVKPAPAPEIRVGDNAFETVARDRLRERQKDRRASDVLDHVKACSE